MPQLKIAAFADVGDMLLQTQLIVKVYSEILAPDDGLTKTAPTVTVGAENDLQR